MDEKTIMEYANKAVESIKGDSSLLSGFSANPADIIKKVIGVELPDDVISKVVEAVKGLLAGGALDAAKDALGNITGAADAAADKASDAAEKSGGILSGAVDAIKKLF